MQTVILAGGLATRLRPLTNDIPKSMIRVNGRPFLEYQLHLLLENKITDIVLCVGHLSQMIKAHFGNGKRFGVNIRYSDEGENLLGTAGALKRAEPLLEDQFLLLYGDSYLPFDYQAVWSYSRSCPESCVLAVYRNHNRYDNSNVAIVDGLVSAYDKSNPGGKFIHIDAGLSVLRKCFLSRIPANRTFPLDALYKKIIEEKKMLAYEVRRRFYEIGSPRGLIDFERLMRSKPAVAV
jgi:MurNAc alpha-1-phosphate uridylyltransferase